MAKAKVRLNGVWVDVDKEAKARSSGIWLDYGSGGMEPEVERFFFNPMTETFDDQDSVEATSTLTMGTAFRVNAPGTVTRGRWRFPNTQDGTVSYKFVLYSATGPTRVREAVFTEPILGEWVEVLLDEPYHASAGEILVPSVYQSGASGNRHYAYKSFYFSQEITRGNLTALGPNQNGRFTFADSYPANAAFGTSYFVDMAFLADE